MMLIRMLFWTELRICKNFLMSKKEKVNTLKCLKQYRNKKISVLLGEQHKIKKSYRKILWRFFNLWKNYLNVQSHCKSSLMKIIKWFLWRLWCLKNKKRIILISSIKYWTLFVVFFQNSFRLFLSISNRWIFLTMLKKENL